MLFDDAPLVMIFVYGFFCALLWALYDDLWGDGSADFLTLLKYALYGAIIMTALEWLWRLVFQAA